MKLGQVRDKDLIRNKTIDEKQKLSQGLFEVHFTVSGVAYDLVVDKILSFDKENINDWTDADISYHLEKCALYRFSFLSAAEELTKLISIKKRDFNRWFAEVTTIARKELLQYRRDLREKGDAASWLGSITKQEIEDWIISNQILNNKYNLKLEDIEELESNKKKLIELRNCMEERAFDLKAIGEMRMKQRFDKISVKGEN